MDVEVNSGELRLASGLQRPAALVLTDVEASEMHRLWSQRPADMERAGRVSATVIARQSAGAAA